MHINLQLVNGVKEGTKGLIVAWNKGLLSDPNSPNYNPSVLKISKTLTGKKRLYMLGDLNPAKKLEVRIKISESKKGENNVAKRLEVREKYSLIRKGWKHIKNPDEVRKKMSEALKGRKFTEQHKSNLAKSSMLARELRPNKLEMKFENLLLQCFPTEYKYVGGGEFILGGKCPDFLNVNGKKKVIEVFGNYWHKGEDPNVIIEHYKKYGFDCLVVWENEINSDLNGTLQKVIQFTEG